VAALQRAVALAQMDGAPGAVAEHLDFDVARRGEIFFEIDGVVAERRLRLHLRLGQRVSELVGRTGDAHAPAAAARRRLDQHRIADLRGDRRRFRLVADRSRRTGTQGMPSRVAVRLASILSPIRRICSALGR